MQLQLSKLKTTKMQNFKSFSEELQPGAVPEPGRESIGGRFQSAAPKKATKPAPLVTSEDTEVQVKSFSDFLEGRCWPGYKSVPGKKPYSPGSCVKEASAGAIAAATAIAKKKSGDYDKEGFRKTPYKNPDSPNRKSNAERKAELKEDLRKWFSKTDPKGDWKRINSKGEAIGPCAREPGEAKPKCMSKAQRASLSKTERASAVRRKRQQDPNPERQGKPIDVKSKVNENMEQLDEKNKPTNPELWSRAVAQARAKFDVYPSAYANGWASKWYKEHGGGWKSVSEAAEVGDDPTNQESPRDLEKRGNKTVVKRFKEISEIVMPQVKNDLSGLDKTSFIKKHGISKLAAKAKVTEAKDEQEYGYEGDMALNQLKTLVRCAEMIEDMLKPDTDLPEWVQSKITLATDYIQTAADYMYSEMKEEVQIDELSNDLLGRYKTAAGADASKADKAGDYNKGNKRFGGILKATKKQFSNDLRKESVTSITNREDEPHEIIHKKTNKVVSTHKNYTDAYAAYEKLGRGPEGMTDHAIGHIEPPRKKMKEEVMQEGRPSQRHPLEGHEYHRKSDEALVHIAKDAHAAAEAMKSHNTTAENKYRDQANDSATVRHYRKTHGMADWYKKKYGHMKEDTKQDNKPPFDGPYKKYKGDVKDKSGAVHTARSMAKDAAHKGMQMAMNKKGIKESKQASIVRDAVKSAKDKKKAASEDKFQADPVLSNSITRNV
jgi:hypothetical protein